MGKLVDRVPGGTTTVAHDSSAQHVGTGKATPSLPQLLGRRPVHYRLFFTISQPKPTAPTSCSIRGQCWVPLTVLPIAAFPAVVCVVAPYSHTGHSHKVVGGMAAPPRAAPEPWAYPCDPARAISTGARACEQYSHKLQCSSWHGRGPACALGQAVASIEAMLVRLKVGRHQVALVLMDHAQREGRGNRQPAAWCVPKRYPCCTAGCSVQEPGPLPVALPVVSPNSRVVFPGLAVVDALGRCDGQALANNCCCAVASPI